MKGTRVSKYQSKFLFCAFVLLIGLDCTKGIAACSWEELSQIALNDSGRLGGAEEQVKARDELRKEAFAGHLPQIDLVAKKGDSNTSILNTNSSKEVEEYGFEAGLSLFEGFAVSATIARRRAEKNIAEAERDLSSVELRYELRRAYFRNLILQERVEFAEELFNRRKETLRLMKIKYKSGREPKWGVEKAESDLAQIEFQLAEQRELLEMSQAEIRALIGGKKISCLKVPGKIDEIIVEAKVIDFSLQKHPKNEELRSRIEAAGEEERQAESDYYPKVNAFYSYKKQGNETVPDPVSVSTWALTVNFNIFDGLGKKRRVEAARAKKLGLELRQSAELLELETKELQAEKRFKRKQQGLPVMQNVYQSAKRRLDTVSKQYSLGRKSFIDWEQAQVKLADAELDLVAHKADTLQALADWERASGMRLEDR